MASNEEIRQARIHAGEGGEPVVRGPYLPPLEDPRNPMLMPARTYTDVSIEEAAATKNRVVRANVEPGPSEFSHGRGMVAPLDLATPGPEWELIQSRRTNPADPTDAPVWDEERQWQAAGPHQALIRETEDPAVD